MQVQKINSFYFAKNNSINKTNKSKAPVFKAYGDVMSNVIKRDLRDVTDVSSAFRDLFRALKSTPGVKIGSDLAILENNNLECIASFMDKITAPIAKVPSVLRDLVFKAEEQNLILLDKDGVGTLMMTNFGKKGFLNSIFNSQDARSDIKFLFSSPNYDSFQVSINKKGGLRVEQMDYPDYKISEYGIFSRCSEKYGTVDTTAPIW